MLLKYILLLALVTATGISAEKNKVLSRQRRFLAFPDGASFSASICMTIGVIGNPVLEYLSWAVNWGIAYELPNQTWYRQHSHGFSNLLESQETKIRSRYRRDLYGNIETILDSMGFSGRDCVARTLCEVAKFLRSGKGNMVEEIIKTIFSIPGNRRNAHKDPDAHHYDKAFSIGRVRSNCQRLYANCHISLLDLALGKYSVEPTKHGPRDALKFM